MYVFIKNKEEFNNFSNKNFIKVSVDKMMDSFEWNNLPQNNEEMQRYEGISKLFLHYQLLVRTLEALQGSYVALNMSPADILLPMGERAEALTVSKIPFKLRGKIIFVGYEEKEINNWLNLLENKEELDINYLNNEELEKIIKKEIR